MVSNVDLSIPHIKLHYTHLNMGQSSHRNNGEGYYNIGINTVTAANSHISNHLSVSLSSLLCYYFRKTQKPRYTESSIIAVQIQMT